MLRDIKKYWYIWRFRKNLRKYNEGLDIGFLLRGGQACFPKDSFNRSLAGESAKRFSWIFWWRLRKNWKDRRLRRKIDEYNSIFSVLLNKENLFGKHTDELRGVLYYVNPDGDDYIAILPFLERLLKKYYLAWTAIIIPLLIGALGSSLLSRIPWSRIGMFFREF